jgi:hypothetical protein|tara:strand:- start:700 stop:924 length:225 start_codon:yes stop_codon:yes gene_type:complete
MEKTESFYKDSNWYGLQMNQIHFDDKELNKISTANVNVTSAETLDYTLDELEDCDDNYVDDTGWNRFTVNQWKL